LKLRNLRPGKIGQCLIKGIANEHYPRAKRITLVMDNYNTHGASAFMKHSDLKKQKGYGTGLNLCIPPKHGSWLNMAEIRAACTKRAMFKPAYSRNG